MKKLHGTATEVVAAPLDQCLALLEAVDRYPTWYPEVVRDVEVLDRDPSGQPTRARTKLHVSRGPLVKDFDLILAIVVEPPATVRLSRPTNEPCQQQFGVVWRLQEGEDGTRIELSLDADLRVPRFLPVGGIGNSMAKGFVAAARRALASRGRP
jgi:ribosome-associated toxin RatA of RatAB toxin-antitoxin module